MIILKTYQAVDIAKFVISYANHKGKPVTPLRLQKLLFFLWVEVRRMSGIRVFDDTIYAWEFGPVVLSVYIRFCANGGMAIRDTYDNVYITVHDSAVFAEILDAYMVYSARELINLSRIKGMAWDKVFKNGEGNQKVIPFKLIEENDCLYSRKWRKNYERRKDLG